MKNIKISLVVFAVAVFFWSCDDKNGGGQLVDGGTVSDQGVAVNPAYVSPEGVEAAEGGPNEASNLKASTKARLRFDE